MRLRVQQLKLRLQSLLQPKKPSKKQVYATLLCAGFVLILVGILFLGVVDPAFAQDSDKEDAYTGIASIAAAVPSGVVGFFLWFVNGILSAIMAFLGFIAMIVFKMLAWSFTFTKVLDVDAVQTGWGIVRDFSNMFFILVLLVIAFGTILGQEKYNYRKLLPNFIIMAILINFSQVIAGVFIDLSNVIMFTFTNAIGDRANPFAGSLVQTFGIGEYLQLGAGQVASSAITVTGAYLLGIMFMVMLIGVSLIYVIVFFSRTVALWILVILMPLAFLANTIPQGQPYWQRWWKEFSNYILAGPLLAFFLWLALLIATNTSADGGTGSQGTNYIQQATTKAPSDIDLDFQATDAEVESQLDLLPEKVYSLDVIIRFVVAMILLLLGLKFTEELKVVGSGLASDAAEALPGIAAGVATAGFYQTAKDYGSGAWKGLTDRVSEIRGDTKSRGQNLGAQVGNVYDRMTPAVTQAQIAQKQGRIDKYDKSEIERAGKQGRFGTMNNQQLRNIMGGEDRHRAAAAMETLAKRGDLNNADVDDVTRTLEQFSEGSEIRNQFEDTLRKNNPEIAMLTLYNNPDGTNNREKLFNDFNENKISGGNLGAALNNQQAFEAWEDDLTPTAIIAGVNDNKIEEGQKLVKNLTPARREEIFGDMRPEDMTPPQRAKAAQMTGMYDRSWGWQNQDPMRSYAQNNQKEFEAGLANHPQNWADPGVLTVARETVDPKKMEKYRADRRNRDHLREGYGRARETVVDPGTGAATPVVGSGGLVVELNNPATGPVTFNAANNAVRNEYVELSGEIMPAFNGQVNEIGSALQQGQITTKALAATTPAQMPRPVVQEVSRHINTSQIKQIFVKEGNEDLARRVVAEVQGMRQSPLAPPGTPPTPEEQRAQRIIDSLGDSEWGRELLP